MTHEHHGHIHDIDNVDKDTTKHARLPMTPPHTPIFEDVIHVGRPNIGDRSLFDRLVNDIFEKRWFTNNGQLVRTFEQRLCEYLGVRHCIPVCNATVGLQLACHALDLTGEVILPAYTFIATAHAVQWERIRPVFADIDPKTHNIDVNSIETLVTKDTSAILGVHVWGRPCDTEAIDRIADRHGLLAFYDAAHAFGCAHRGSMIGNYGRCEIFSFHATKFFNTFEGGAIATNDDALAHKIRLMKNFGFAGLDSVIHLGTNGKMPEICAAMGLASFEKLDDIIAANRSNYETYQAHLADIPGVQMTSYNDLERTNYQYIIVEVHEAHAGLTRDQLMAVLHANNVRCRRYFYPGCHRMEPYKTIYPHQVDSLPATDLVCQRVLCLPTGTTLSQKDVEVICGIIRTGVRNARLDSLSKVNNTKQN